MITAMLIRRHLHRHGGLNVHHLSVLWHHLLAGPFGPWLLVAAVVVLVVLYISR